MVPEQRIAPGAVDHDASRLEHRDRVLGRHDGRGTPHRVRHPAVDQVAERAFDGVEWTEAERPAAQQRHQVRCDRLPRRDALGQLVRIEEGSDAVSVDRIGAVGLDRIREEVGSELNHAGPRVLAALFVERHRQTFDLLQQSRQEEPDGPRADDVHVLTRRQGVEGGGAGRHGHRPPRSCRSTLAREATSGDAPDEGDGQQSSHRLWAANRRSGAPSVRVQRARGRRA